MLVVEFAGAQLDIDPLDLDMAALDQIEQRAGIKGLAEFISGLGAAEPNAWRALYWASMLRTGGDPGPFGDFRGPNMREVFGQIERVTKHIEAFSVEVNSASPKAPAEPSVIDGSPSSDTPTPGAVPLSSTD